MGTWGVEIFSDDFAADIKDSFFELVGDGMPTADAAEKLIAEQREALRDSDDGPVFWLALAAIQWKLGRLEERTMREAIRVIDSGADLARWDTAAHLKKRAAVLAKLRARLLSPPPPPKRIPRRIRSANDWALGEVVGFQLISGKWTVLRVIGHHSDKGGRSATCELLDWTGNAPPSADVIDRLPMREGRHISQFLFQEPRKKKDQSRVLRLGVISKPRQKPAGYTVLIWPHVDRQMKQIFGLE